MKNTLDQLNNRLDISEEEISELESRAIEAIQDDMQREKKIKVIKALVVLSQLLAA